MLVRVQLGLTLQETLDRLNTGFDPDADLPQLRPTDAQRDEWDRILGRVSRDVGPVESEEFPYSLTLETVGPPGRVQLDYCGDTAHIEVAYHHSGPAALEVMELAYRIACIVEDESGLTGHDFEVGQPTRTGDPVKAAVRLSGVSDWAQHRLSQCRDRIPSPTGLGPLLPSGPDAGGVAWSGPSPAGRGSAHQSPAQPLQPPDRLPPPLPFSACQLQRSRRLPNTAREAPGAVRLTGLPHRMSSCPRPSPGWRKGRWWKS